MLKSINHNHLLIWLSTVIVFILLALVNPFVGLQQSLDDTLYGKSKLPGRIILLKVDDRSLNKIGQWPWPREVFASLIEKLDTASVVGVDIAFKETSRFGIMDDDIFAAALAQSSTPVVFPVEYQETGMVSTLLTKFTEHTESGFTNVLIDQDGVIRAMQIKRKSSFSFARQVSATFKEDTFSTNETLFNSEIPFRIHYRGRNTTYPSFSIVDVLSGNVPVKVFDGKIVLIGVTASDLQNFYQTPFGLISGVEIQASAVDTLLDGTVYRENIWFSVAAIAFLLLLTMLISVYIRNLVLLFGFLVVLLGAYVVFVFVSFDRFVVFDLFYPGIAVVVGAFIFNTTQYIATARREQQIRRAFSHLRAMVESMTEGVVMVDTHYNIKVMNPSAKQILGVIKAVPSIDACVKQLKGILNFKEKLQESMNKRVVVSVPDVLIGERVFQVLFAPVKEKTTTAVGAILGGVVIFHDITNQKEIERLRKDFISMMVHELRAPLDGIKKIAEALLSKDIVTEQRKNYLGMVHSNSAQMLELVNDLLDVAKIEAGKFGIDKKKTDIRQLIDERLQFFETTAQTAHLSLSSHIDEQVPEQILLDARRITQVLNNLISNAVKFTPEGGAVVVHAFLHHRGGNIKSEGTHCNITIHRHVYNMPPADTADALVLAISDSGAGIPSEKLTALFNKFMQFKTNARQGAKGTGLGLAIVKGITEAHGGRVGVASEEGVGSTFYVFIPLTEKDVA